MDLWIPHRWNISNGQLHLSRYQDSLLVYRTASTSSLQDVLNCGVISLSSVGSLLTIAGILDHVFVMSNQQTHEISCLGQDLQPQCCFAVCQSWTRDGCWILFISTRRRFDSEAVSSGLSWIGASAEACTDWVPFTYLRVGKDGGTYPCSYPPPVSRLLRKVFPRVPIHLLHVCPQIFFLYKPFSLRGLFLWLFDTKDLPIGQYPCTRLSDVYHDQDKVAAHF